MPLPGKAVRTTGCLILPPLRSHISIASGKIANAPATTRATIVLPAFVRSLSADGEKKVYKKASLVRSNDAIGVTYQKVSPLGEI
jgi:hypothetical protein